MHFYTYVCACVASTSGVVERKHQWAHMAAIADISRHANPLALTLAAIPAQAKA